jgi:hypothetical protein
LYQSHREDIPDGRTPYPREFRFVQYFQRQRSSRVEQLVWAQLAETLEHSARALDEVGTQIEFQFCRIYLAMGAAFQARPEADRDKEGTLRR